MAHLATDTVISLGDTSPNWPLECQAESMSREGSTRDKSDPGLHFVEHRPHSRTVGNSAETLVVLVHGSLDRGTSFARVVRRLNDLHVITYDRRGYERSREVRPIARSVGEHAADLLRIIGARKSVVIGHSYGGDVALAAAIEDPRSVLAVGAYEPPLPWTDWWPRRSRSQLELEDPAVHAENFFKRMVGEAAWDRLPEATRAARRADGPALAAELTAIREVDAPIDFSRLVVPAAFGRGGDSRPHHRRAAQELVDIIPGSALVEIPGAGHGAHLTHPDAFADFVRTVVSLPTARADALPKPASDHERPDAVSGDLSQGRGEDRGHAQR